MRFTKAFQPCKGDFTMSQSLVKNAIHLVFSTKDRRMFLRDKEREQLHCYITGIFKNKKSPLIEINSVGDHIHILYDQSKNVALAKVVEQVKSYSSGWLKEQHRAYSTFAWQAGYGAFAVSESNIAAIREYVANQREHHRTKTFQEEYRVFLERHRVAYDERYVWD